MAWWWENFQLSCFLSPHFWTKYSLKCATFPPLNAALFLWLNGDLPSCCIVLPIQHTVLFCCKNVFQSTVWCPCKPLSKINSACTSLAQSALSKLLPLSNSKGHIAEPFRRTSSHNSFVLGALKKKRNRNSYRGFGKISIWQLYNGWTSDSSEQRHRRGLSRTCFQWENLENCSVTKQKKKYIYIKKKHSRWIVFFPYSWRKYAFGRGLWQSRPENENLIPILM